MEEKNTDFDIAIVGMAGRFPKADNINEFWENLIKGRDCITRRDGAETDDNMKYAYGAINRAFEFDNELFDINEAEAMKISPQERLLLQISYEALRDAGCNPYKYKGKIGIVCGAAENEYYTKLLKADKSYETVSEIFYTGSYAATRVSYKLNLTGPSIYSVEACATSLYAVHMACKSLLNYEADAMLAGGTNVFPDQERYNSVEGVFSKDGYTRPFDSEGTGFVPGNGTGMILLKRLEDAIEDNDHIYAVIKGSAVGNDGSRKMAFTAPSIVGETEVMQDALDFSELEPSDIDYIETHGTATPIGDGIEIQAMDNVYGKSNKKIAIGSLKGNYGHLNASSGIAAVIKGALVLKNKIIPPTINLNNCNEELQNNNTFYVNKELVKLENKDRLLHAGVSSFGIGGVNSHLILEEYKNKESKCKESKIFINVSANSKNSLEKITEKYKEFLKQNMDKAKRMSYMLVNDSWKHKWRNSFVIDEKNDFILGRPYEDKNNFKNKNIVFLFPGSGCDDVNIATNMYENSEIFAKYYDVCRNEVLEISKGKVDLLGKIKMEDIPLKIVAVDYSIAKMLVELEVTPDYLIGHSLGEYAMAMFNGILTVKDGFKLVYKRNELIKDLPDGHMVAVAATEGKVRSIIREGAYISCINAKDRLMISCLKEDFNNLKDSLDKNNIRYSILPMGKPGHTKIMRLIEDKFESTLGDIEFLNGQYKMISTLYGREINDFEMSNWNYWMDLMASPVLFKDAIVKVKENIPDENSITFIEIGSGNSLTSFVKRQFRGNYNISSLAALGENKNSSEWVNFNLLLGELWKRNIDFNYNTFFKDEDKKKISLPQYPFDEKYFNKLDRFYPATSKIDITNNMVLEIEKMANEGQKNTDILGIRDYKGLYETYDNICLSAAKFYFSNTNIKSNFEYNFEELIKTCQVKDYYKPFIKLLIKYLLQNNCVKINNSKYIFLDCALKENFENDISKAKNEQKLFAPYIDLFAKCVRNYNDVFTGKIAGNSILYPSGSFDMINKIEETIPETSFTSVYLDVMVKAIDEITKDSKEKIKILEIGSGNGKLTWPLMDILKDRNIEYYFTDIGRSFVTQGKEAAKEKEINNMKFRAFDVQKDFEESGFSENEFDLIIGFDVIQATRDISFTIKNLKEMLKPLGKIMMVQSFFGHDIIQMIFGFAPGWWNYENDPLRKDKSIVMPKEDWISAYKDAGYKNVHAFTAGYGEVGIICAMKADNFSIWNKRECINVNSKKSIRKNTSNTSKNMESDTLNNLCNILYETIGNIEIDVDGDIFDLGLDSLSILILQSKVKEKFKYDISIKDFYECSSLRELANRLEKENGIDIKNKENSKKDNEKDNKKSINDLFSLVKDKK